MFWEGKPISHVHWGATPSVEGARVRCIWWYLWGGRRTILGKIWGSGVASFFSVFPAALIFSSGICA